MCHGLVTWLGNARDVHARAFNQIADGITFIATKSLALYHFYCAFFSKRKFNLIFYLAIYYILVALTLLKNQEP
jgi:hypothetical protein